MGEFWMRYLLNNGQRMSKRQMRKVTRLEEEILECLVMIDRLEDVITDHTREINSIKQGGEISPISVPEVDF